MQILNNYSNITGNSSEYEMQEQVDKFLKENKTYEIDYVGPLYEKIELPQIVLREFRVPEVGRISDHVLLRDNRTAVNIECKLSDIGGVIHQAEDHLRWCDYSIICLPPDQGYVANSYKREIMSKGIGLWYWFKDIGIFEFIMPKFNRKKDKDLRKKVIERIKSQAEVQTELF